MSWSGGGTIFYPVCKEIVKSVRNRQMTPESAHNVLTLLIKELRMEDWGDPQESLELFSDHSYVVAAFAANDIVTEDDDACADCGESLEDHCGECEECECTCDEDDEVTTEPNK